MAARFAVVVCMTTCFNCSLAVNLAETYGVFGAVQAATSTVASTSASKSRLLDRCFPGFALSGCVDRSAGTKANVFTAQFKDVSQAYCLQCCTHPVPDGGADELWDLACPLTAAQRLTVSRSDRVFRFARRESLTDDSVVECNMPARTLGTYLVGYSLELFVVERTASMGAKYWREVINCSVTAINETSVPPNTFYEHIRVRSIPTDEDEQSTSRWIAIVAGGAAAAIVIVVAVPVYRGKIRGQRCTHCGTWFMFSDRPHCAVCSILGYNLIEAAPSASTKVHVANE